MTEATPDSASQCPAARQITDYIAGQRDTVFSELKDLVAFNTLHGEEFTKESRQQAVEYLTGAIDGLGLDFKTQTFETCDGSTAIVAQRPAAEGEKTVLLYCHYDVVPVPDASEWTSEPFTLTERDGRWYGRGSADCKGNIVAHLAALRTLGELGDSPLGITLVIEGSEERGGAGLDGLIDDHPELFAADAIMIVDTGGEASGIPTLTTSLRGGALVDVTCSTLKHPMHSGSFGGAAPDAVAALMRTLDSLRDNAGITRIDGVDLGTWEGAPYTPEAFRSDAGVLDGVELFGDKEHQPADLVWASVAVTVIGFDSTPIKDAVNAIPATASARLNLRVPPGMDAAQVADKLVAHLQAHTPWGAQLSAEILDVNEAFATDTSGPALQLLDSCMSEAFGGKQTHYAGSGGSIPLTVKLQQAFPNAEIALYGVEEPECAIHSVDESVDPDEILRIATAEALFLARFARS